MTRRWHFWVALGAVLLGLWLGIRSVIAPSNDPEAIPAVPSATSAPESPSPTPSLSATPTLTAPPAPPTTRPAPTPSTPRTTAAKKKPVLPPPVTPAPTTPPVPKHTPASGPPEGTAGTPERYRSRYSGRYVTWDELIVRGKELPAPGFGCDKAWRSSGKDGRLDWSDAQHWCLSSLNGKAYKPQGVGGSTTASGYRIDGRPADERNIVLITWYSRVKEGGRFANGRGESATKMTVIDLDVGRYNTVELVRPTGGRTFSNLDSHGSGVAWAGQYLYTSSLSVLWMYNADDLMMIDGRFVLPAVSRWSVNGKGGMSSISIDRSTEKPRLSAINYTMSGATYIQTFPLTDDGRLATGADRRGRGLTLRNTFGPFGTVHSASTMTVPGSNFQGVARTGPYTFANSSALKINGRKGKGDATVVLKEGRVIKRLRMPRTNVESIYLDQRRDTFVSVTEHGTQFLFSLPVAALITAAER